MANTKCIIYSINRLKPLISEVLHTSLITKSFCQDTDFILYTSFQKIKCPVFDKIIFRPDNSKLQFEYRIDSYIDAFSLDYEKILFIDSDAAFVNEGANNIFDLLDNFDIAVAHAPVRSAAKEKDRQNDKVPDSFPEFNCGIIACNNSPQVLQLFKEWHHLYTTKSIVHPHDQGAFRHAIYFSGLRIATLTPEYNNRTENRDDCKIWHNRAMLQSY